MGGSNYNAWQDITPYDYDTHMSHPNVAQTQMLNRIIKEQAALVQERYAAARVAVLGVTNGNGLEHMDVSGIAEVIGVDINEAFLRECQARYAHMQAKVKLVRMDLMKETERAIEVLSGCDLLIADLLIKHIHLDNFMRIMAGLPKHNQIVSCVIQVNPDGVAVSHSGCERVFDGVSVQREEENEDTIVSSMHENGFGLVNRVVYTLPNGKLFVRMDFIAG